jgi:tRNA G18 (ribose-2'-O)-methylase SpoU
MFTVHRIDSLDLPELAPYRTLRRPTEHKAQGIFVAEGDKVVHRLLESSLSITSVLIPEHRWTEYEPGLSRRPENITAYVTPKSVVEQLVGFHMFQGVMAVAKIPPPVTLDELLDRSPSPRLFAAADGLMNAENTGALVRNCVAFGVQALLVGETCASPFLRRAVRNSMGTVFQLPVVPTASLVAAIKQLQTRGMRCLAAHPHTQQKQLWQADFSGDCCIVLGSEGVGLSAPVREACDAAVAIPMQFGVDSLNVASASAVFLYEANRQRSSLMQP